MANPFKEALGGSQAQQGGNMNFVQFMMQNRGKDPNQLLDQLLSSGKVNQNQLNQAQQAAKQFGSRFDGFRAMFGF